MTSADITILQTLIDENADESNTRLGILTADETWSIQAAIDGWEPGDDESDPR